MDAASQECLTYHIVAGWQGVQELVDLLEKTPEFAFDFETTGLETHALKLSLVALGICTKPGTVYCVPFHKEAWPDEVGCDDLYPELVHVGTSNKILKMFADVMEDPNILKIGHNIKYEARVLHSRRIILRGISFDTMVANYCLYGGRMPHNLDDLTTVHLNRIKVRQKTVLPRKTVNNQNPSMAQSPYQDVALYNSDDCDCTYRLGVVLREKLEQNPHAKKLHYEIEHPALIELIHMECNGVHYDTTRNDKLRESFAAELTQIQDRVNQEAGWQVRISNNADIQKLLYTQLKLPEVFGVKVRATKTGLTVDGDTLRELAASSVVQDILRWKEVSKLQNTYVLSIAELISDKTGLLHASFNQASTETGRLSSSEPNLQNIPTRTQIGKEIRKAFISRFHGGKIGSFDLSQAEMRILAHLSRDPILMDTYLRDQDIHRRVAATINNCAESEVTKLQRDKVKVINYGLMYGMTEKRLADETGSSFEEAKQLMEAYLGSLKGVDQWIKQNKEFLRYHGYVETLSGRRRYISKIFAQRDADKEAAEREGTNMPVQGMNADIVKLAMAVIGQQMREKQMKSLMIMQVHDELVFDTYPGEEALLEPIVTKALCEAMIMCVPMKADGHFADNWAEAH